MPCTDRLPLWALLAGLFLLALLGGCAPVVTSDGRLPAPGIEGEQLLAAWTAQAGRYQAVQGLAKVKVKTPERSASGTQVIIARRPGQLRAETLSPFGTTLLLLATDGTDLGVLVPSQNRYYFGKADADNVGRFTKIPVEPITLVNTLLYDAPVLAFSKVTTWSLPAGGWVVELSRWGGRQELVFDSQRRLIAMRYFENGDPVLTIDYNDFPETGPVFPRQVGLHLYKYDVEARMTFEEVELDRSPAPGLFRLEPPVGVETYDLDFILYSTDKVGEKR